MISQRTKSALKAAKRANGSGMLAPVCWFSCLDLDFGVSDPGEVAVGIDHVLNATQGLESMHGGVWSPSSGDASVAALNSNFGGRSRAQSFRGASGCRRQ